jgi:uncharacterized protein with gpF-like domain
MGRLRRAFSRLELSVSYRAHYAIAAAQRITESLRGGKSMAEATAKERPYFTRHREQVRQRDAARRMVEAAQERYGPVLGWRHGNPREPRPAHLAADGKNFRADRVPASTGALPGVLPNCTCVAVAPFDNAEVLR